MKPNGHGIPRKKILYDNPTLAVPTAMIETILGYGTEENPRVLGEVTFESLQSDDSVNGWADNEGPTTNLTITQFGQMVAWAFADADDGWFDHPTTELETVLDCRTGAADNLRNVMLWIISHMPENWSCTPRPLEHTQWLADLLTLHERRPKDL